MVGTPGMGGESGALAELEGILGWQLWMGRGWSWHSRQAFSFAGPLCRLLPLQRPSFLLHGHLHSLKAKCPGVSLPSPTAMPSLGNPPPTPGRMPSRQFQGDSHSIRFWRLPMGLASQCGRSKVQGACQQAQGLMAQSWLGGEVLQVALSAVTRVCLPGRAGTPSSCLDPEAIPSQVHSVWAWAQLNP